MAALTAAVGSIGLAGTLRQNVLDRSREIGGGAIGAHDGVIVSMVVAEGLLIGLMSFIGSTLLALPITYGLTQIICALSLAAMRPFARTTQLWHLARPGRAVGLARQPGARQERGAAHRA